jgi:hypothetical protein
MPESESGLNFEGLQPVKISLTEDYIAAWNAHSAR